MVKIIKTIYINNNGELNLKDIELSRDSIGISLEPSKLLFECIYCNKRSNGIISIDRLFIKDKYTFVLYYCDPHDEYEENNKCKCPVNPLSKTLLYSKCNCGYESHNYDHKGCFYLIKYDPSKKPQNEKIDFNKPITYEKLEYFDTSIDCNENDIKFIQEQLQQMK